MCGILIYGLVFEFQLIEKCVRVCVASTTHLFSNVGLVIYGYAFEFQLIEKCVRECVSSIIHLFSNSVFTGLVIYGYVVFTGLVFLYLVRGSL
jgi:hypothetical protein